MHRAEGGREGRDRERLERRWRGSRRERGKGRKESGGGEKRGEGRGRCGNKWCSTMLL